MIGTSLGSQVQLYASVAALNGTGGASIAAWADGAGARPRDAVLLWTNGGAGDVVIGDATTPAQLFVDGSLAAVLFEGHQVTVSAGQSIWCPLPPNMPALGNVWSIFAPLAGSGITLTIVARRIDTTAPTAAEAATAAWADVTGAAVAARVASLLPSYSLDDNVTRTSAGLPLTARRRFYASAAHLAAATAGGALTGSEVATVTMTWTYAGSLLTAQRGAT